MNPHGMAVIQTSWSVVPCLNKFINFGNVFSDIIVFLFFLQLPLTWYLCLHNYILSSNLARSLHWTRTNSCFCWAHAINYTRVWQDRSTTYELCLRFICVRLQHSIKALFYFLGISTQLAATFFAYLLLIKITFCVRLLFGIDSVIKNPFEGPQHIQKYSVHLPLNSKGYKELNLLRHLLRRGLLLGCLRWTLKNKLVLPAKFSLLCPSCSSVSLSVLELWLSPLEIRIWFVFHFRFN